MKQAANFPLAPLTTFQVPATAAHYVRFDTSQEIVHYLQSTNLAAQPFLILGGGSNILFVSDFPGTILHPCLKGKRVVRESPEHVWLLAMAGEKWDDLVALTVERGWGGLENLSLIPGSVGASVIQNIGAYGVEAGNLVDRIEGLSLADGQAQTFSPRACGFGYRTSYFKTRWRNRYLITSVVFRLTKQPRWVLDYAGVETAVKRLGKISLANLRQAIITLRQAKLPDPARIGNGGSFFKNPTVGRATLNKLLADHPDLPHYPHSHECYKLAAGWLIEACGWKGKALGRAGVFEKQALVLVNRGGATGHEIYDLAEKIRETVLKRFGIDLEREVIVIG